MRDRGGTGGEGLAERFADEAPLLLDGATGTELERLGIRSTLPLWSSHALLEAPQAVVQVHRAYVAAGAELITANTFRTQWRTLERGHHGSRHREFTRLAVDLARRATEGAPRRVFVLGSAPPLEDCYRPDLVPSAKALAREHAMHANNLVEAGVDGILAETLNCVREAEAAARAAREAGSPVLVSFLCDGGARLASGEPLEAALQAVAIHEPLAVGVNCLSPDSADRCVPVLQQARRPFFVYANLGSPDAAGNFLRNEENEPEAFAARAGAWLRAGARMVGGCCGTTADHIEAMALVLRREAARGR